MIVFAGGGTGGHLTPGLAVAEALRQTPSHGKVLFVGTNKKIERTMIPPEFERRGLTIEPTAVLRQNPARFGMNNLKAVWESIKLLRQERARLVVGLGGYASVPTVLAARWLKLPIVLLEQNVIPGRATRWLARFAAKVCVTFDETVARLPGAAVEVTGNPVRREIAEQVGDAVSTATAGTKTLLVLGGSQGARPINDAITYSVGSGLLKDVRIVHQTGPDDLARVRNFYGTAAIDFDVAPFFSDMPARYRTADVIVSRAGATTLAEIACAGVPSILVPYPQAADNHQQHNARIFAAAGAAVLIPQMQEFEAFARGIAGAVTTWLTDTAARQQAQDALKTLRRPDAAARVAAIISQFMET